MHAGAQSHFAPPPIPYEDVGACPFEGCVYREWTASRNVNIRASRRKTAPVRFRVKVRERVVALTGVVVTVKPARVEFSRPQILSTRDGDVHVLAGQSLYLLTYLGEGFSKVWFNGHLYTDVDVSSVVNDVCDSKPDRCAGRIVEEGQTMWWVQIRNARGEIGWTDEADAFDGKDALAGIPASPDDLRSDPATMTDSVDRKLTR